MIMKRRNLNQFTVPRRISVASRIFFLINLDILNSCLTFIYLAACSCFHMSAVDLSYIWPGAIRVEITFQHFIRFLSTDMYLSCAATDQIENYTAMVAAFYYDGICPFFSSVI